MKDRLKRWFKLRFAITYPFVAFALLFANCDDKSMLVGIWFIIAGLFVRVWANGYAIKSEKLTTSGPYAFVRHPLYLGTMLLVAGFIIMLRLYYIGILLFAAIAAVYYRTIKKEEGMLRQRFKDLYVNYEKKVPAIVPSIFPYREGEKWPFSIKRLLRSQEYKLFIWMIILVIIFYLKYAFLIRHEGLNARTSGLIITMFILAFFDPAAGFIRRMLRWD